MPWSQRIWCLNQTNSQSHTVRRRTFIHTHHTYTHPPIHIKVPSTYFVPHVWTVSVHVMSIVCRDRSNMVSVSCTVSLHREPPRGGAAVPAGHHGAGAGYRCRLLRTGRGPPPGAAAAGEDEEQPGRGLGPSAIPRSVTLRASGAGRRWTKIGNNGVTHWL